MAPPAKRRRPPKTQTKRPGKRAEPASSSYWDVAQRPLQCLVFLLPMVLLYEFGMAAMSDDLPIGPRPALASQQLLVWFFSLFGVKGYYLPGIALIAVLLSWHIAARHPWRVDWTSLFGMAGESILLALPLLILNHWFPALQAVNSGAVAHSSTINDLLLSIGAGIYEELVFRLIVISGLTFVVIDFLKARQVLGVALAVILSSLMFAAHHYPPIGADPWSASEFAFRAVAGGFLAGVFVVRGFGLAVGCHIVYDVMAFLL